MTYQCQRGPPNNQNSTDVAVPQQDGADSSKPSKAAAAVPYDNYLQLRKDAMRIPMQFFFKSRLVSDEKVDGGGGDYFSFNANTEEAKDEQGNRSRNLRNGANSSNHSRI